MENKQNDMLTMIGNLTIERYNKDGKLIELRKEKNTVVAAGKNFIAARMAGTSKAVMTHMGIGVGTTAVNTGTDTTLGSQKGNRNTFSETPLLASNAMTYKATFIGDSTYTGAITEAAIFNASTAGDMLCRTVFLPVNKTDNDTISITWTVTVA